MEQRPKVRPINTAFDKTLELLGLLFLFIMWGITIYIFTKLPNIIPIHFNASGSADNYGNKNNVLVLPIISTIIYLVITLLNKYPHIFNYASKITEQNALKQYSIATRMLRFLKLAIQVLFSTFLILVFLNVKGITNGLGYWFLPFTIILLLTPTIYYLTQSFKKSKI
jgi:uncharacterized membrane protein